MSDEQDIRAAFEAWISAPPFEHSLARWPDDWKHTWPGQYARIDTQLAWEAWRESAKARPVSQPQPAIENQP
ncbi:MAG: hypothetical protein VW239_00315 [Candidatus Nanopelagicales bacterium]